MTYNFCGIFDTGHTKKIIRNFASVTAVLGYLLSTEPKQISPEYGRLKIA